jgi:hypothetical protein
MEETYKLYKLILETQPKKALDGKLAIEILYGKETGFDPLAGLQGAVQAYREFYGVDPVNMGKYPPGPGPDPDDTDKLFQKIAAKTAEIEERYKKIQALYIQAAAEAGKAIDAYNEIKVLFGEIYSLCKGGK